MDEMEKALTQFIEKTEKIISDCGCPEFVRICICGDVFENHITISNEAIHCCANFFSSLDKIGCKTYIIGGNHDYSTGCTQRLDSLSPIFNLGRFTNISYLDKEFEYKSGCLVDDNVVFCLYSTFDNFNKPQDLIEKKLNNKDKLFVGLIHGEINGSSNDNGVEMKHGLTCDYFSDMDIVLAGHIHKFQEIKCGETKIVYSSSMIQQNRGETVSKHGFVVWDVNEKDYEFVKINNSDYGFYNFEINNIEDIEEDNEKFLNE